MALTIQMLRIEPPGPADLDEALGVLVKNVDQMNDLVTALLDYSKLVSGRIPVQLGPFDPRRLLGEVHDSLAATAAHRGLALGLEIDEGLPAEVVSDYAKCRQVVFNLASNALKFTPEGSVVLRARPDDPGRWALEVSYTGVGIAAEEVELVFEEFGQAQIGRPTDAPGTGLGLTICRRLVDLLGGRLSVRSELGRGSTFTATWPIRVVADSASH
jgi:signal transduction histidine kinase